MRSYPSQYPHSSTLLNLIIRTCSFQVYSNDLETVFFMLDLNKTRHDTLPHAMPAACRLIFAARPSGSLQYKYDLFFVKAGCGQATERLFVVAYVLDLDSGFGVVGISHVSDIPLPVL